ncbi:MAG: stage II sporulation protein P [Clostridia bacterium]
MKITVAFLGNRKNSVKNYMKKYTKIHAKRQKKYINTNSKSYKKDFIKKHVEVEHSNIGSISDIKNKNSKNSKNSRNTKYTKTVIENKINRKICDEIKSQKSKKNISAIAFLIISIVIISFFAKFILVNKTMLNFATNFRQAEDNKFELQKAISVYNLYNTENYIYDSSQEKAAIKEKIVQKDKVELSEDEAIDSLAVDKNVVDVFGRKNIEVQITEDSKDIQRISVDKTKILNYSKKRNIDFNTLINKNIVMTKSSDKILLYNTHTSESYANSDKYKFEYTGTKRTTDAKFNMLSIAEKLNENLKSKGFESIQNTTPHDYGTYTSAYAKSKITVKDALQNMNGAGISIDVHRDAGSDLEFRPVTAIKGIQVAQCMFVVGAGTDVTKNEYFEDNLSFALKLQKIADEVYPGLFRPMIIRSSLYNQDLNKYSLLIEVGATGNTIDEAKLTTRCITNLLNILYKD